MLVVLAALALLASSPTPLERGDRATTTAAGITFSPPVRLGPAGGAGRPPALSANESKTDNFFSLSPTHIVGMYGQGPPEGAGANMPLVASTDSGRSFHIPGNLSCGGSILTDDGYGECWEGSLIAGTGPKPTLFSVGAVRPPTPPGARPTPDGWTKPPWFNFSASVITRFDVAADGAVRWRGRVPQRVDFLGLPIGAHRGCGLDGLSLYTSGAVRLPSGAIVHTAIVCWRNVSNPRWQGGKQDQFSIVAFRTTPGQDFVFRYSGTVIDSADLLPWSMFGPNEHDLTLLADGRTIMAAIRYDGNDDCGTVTHRTPAPFTSTGYTTYYQSFSSDGGSRWSTATPMLGMGSVRPRLHLLRPSGPLLLSGGRFCAEGIGGLFMWVNHDGMGKTWEAVDLAAVHDRLVQDPSLRFGVSGNASGDWGTQAYTSLVGVGGGGAVVMYNKYWSLSCNAECSAGFAMRLSV